MAAADRGSHFLRVIGRLPLRYESHQQYAQRPVNWYKGSLRRPLSTSPRTHVELRSPEPESVSAAPPIDFEAWEKEKQENSAGGPEVSKEKLRKLRIVPASPSYFSGKPRSTDNLIAVQEVLHRWQRLPTLSRSEAPQVTWMPFSEYKEHTGNEKVKRREHEQLLAIVQRLNLIVPQIRPPEVVQTIRMYERDRDPRANKAKPLVIDEWGRVRAVGRRKSSSAQIFLVEGEGEVRINGKTLADAFSRIHDRESVVWALKATERIDKYNVWAMVSGGGTTGQAEALTLGIGKALAAHEPSLGSRLKKGKYSLCPVTSEQKANNSSAGCLDRDARMVERKKPGRVKARKKPTWVKR